MSSSYASMFNSLGISSDQADLYTSLIQNGPQTAIQLAKSTAVKRTYVYRLCEQLIALGLIRQEMKGKTATFVAENPDKLLEIAENQKRIAETAAHSLENILPTLKSQFAATDVRPTITYYEGVEGVKKIFAEVYAPKQEPVYGCTDMEAFTNDWFETYLKNIIPARIKNNVFSYAIFCDTKASRALSKDNATQNRITSLIDKNKYPMPAEIDIFEDKVALMTLSKSGFVGVLIQNQDIATTLKSIFRYHFDHLKH